MDLMNFDNDGKIGYLEFEIFYFKSMLGSWYFLIQLIPNWRLSASYYIIL